MSLAGQLYAISCTICWAVTPVSFAYAGRRVGSVPVVVMPLTLWLEKDRITRRAFTGALIAIASVYMLCR